MTNGADADTISPLAMTPPHAAARLTRGPLLARNVLWNLAGLLLPLAVAIAAAPPLIRGLGVERFGILSLAWTVIGYFSLFDLGLGRALTKLASDRLATQSRDSIAPVAWTGITLLVALGSLGTVAAWALAGWLVDTALHIQGDLRAESLGSFYWLGAAIPLITLTSGLRGLLEAGQHFTAVNLIRLPMSVFSFIGPLLVLPFSRNLVPVVVVLVAGRLVAAAAHLAVCLRLFPAMRRPVSFDRAIVGPSLALGGWMTVTNIVGPLMTHLDRFLVGVILSVGAIAYYTTPFDVVTRFLVVPGAVASVLFPAFAFSLAGEPERTTLLVARGTKYIFFAILPITLAAAALAPEALEVWLGPVFAERSATPLRWLAVGVVANGLAQMPFVLLQAGGKPDVAAKLHLVELPIYLAGLWALTASYGITGTAVAWTARCVVDAVALFALARPLLRGPRTFMPTLALASLATAGLFLAATLAGGLAARALVLALALAGIAAAAWRSLAADERAFIVRALSVR